ncbi:type II secretion system F family protein [Telmatobacter sp. DSM 110680]|uniref:Type II secretion system F family protein n=1 Tax=Telmatobacter sp. DSM 110680 TaxID=3036704 RepID=A0AAU7DGM6_9BACT
MAVIVGLVFLGVFGVVVLIAAASGSGATEQTRAIMTRLESAIAVGKPEMADLIVDVRKSELMSSIPWLDRFLSKLELAPRIRRFLYQANVKWTVGGLSLLCGVCFVVPAYLAYWRTGAIFAAILVGFVTGAAPVFWVFQKRKRRMNKFEEGIPEALELIVSALRVGHSLNAAMGLVSRECSDPVGGEFRLTFDEMNYGLELKSALDNLVVRVPLQDVKIVCTAILIQRESGGNLAEVLEKTSQVIRERFRLKRQVLTHTAQGRLTGWILTLLPVVLGMLLYFVNPDLMSMLWKKDLGIKLLYAAGTMIVIGGLIIRKIVNMDV